ncbi:class I SAM-dependent methyltransferase [Pseudoponticoccus marisrubri]|uniref:Methyltransferase n=1 Tax=Pseudoponticoccus marisrubri TaxID=1685382 RepID=A0A0W7WIL2_9RHOB|nr:class I SAM-dependent methyltransferase [Pseudoponticoccus marisrubri]KUF10450.1 methyltransferase [Pseudoponticoccus marisrubri]
MVTVQEQYEAYPYPERDPKDEKKRLITGSPSHPHEIDHFLFAGQRDWSQPLRVLVAGGGTGDGLIQLATVLAHHKRPAEITYLDLSGASRKVAEARAKVRKLDMIRFETGSLLDAAEYGQFDYIDCCGVLHHLPDPAAGFRALRAALAPGGGLGFMVYAPYGRSGVYPLQQAFDTLFAGLSPKERLKAARGLVRDLPEGHPFAVNSNLVDHKASDAGFYDLLLHGQDRAFTAPELLTIMDETGWRLQSFCTPALYDLSRLTKIRPEGLGEAQAMGAAEKLRGVIKLHVGYAVPSEDMRKPATATNRALIPHLRGAPAARLAQEVAQVGTVPLTLHGIKTSLRLPREAAPLIAGIDGVRSLSQIAAGAGMDALTFGSHWMKLERELASWGLLLYSGLGKG